MVTLTTTGFVQLGSNTAGAISVTGHSRAPHHSLTSRSSTTGAIGQNNIIAVHQLRVTSPGPVALDSDNVVDDFAASGLAAGAGLIFHNAAALQIADRGRGQAASPAAGDADVSATGPITVAGLVVVDGDVVFTAEESADEPFCANDLTVASGVSVQSTGGSVALNAGDDIILEAGSMVIAAEDLEVNAGFTTSTNVAI